MDDFEGVSSCFLMNSLVFGIINPARALSLAQESMETCRPTLAYSILSGKHIANHCKDSIHILSKKKSKVEMKNINYLTRKRDV